MFYTFAKQRCHPKQARVLDLGRWAFVGGVNLGERIIDPIMDPRMDPRIQTEIKDIDLITII